MAKCPFCGQRKGKRKCQAVEAFICSPWPLFSKRNWRESQPRRRWRSWPPSINLSTGTPEAVGNISTSFSIFLNESLFQVVGQTEFPGDRLWPSCADRGSRHCRLLPAIQGNSQLNFFLSIVIAWNSKWAVALWSVSTLQIVKQSRLFLLEHRLVS